MYTWNASVLHLTLHQTPADVPRILPPCVPPLLALVQPATRPGSSLLTAVARGPRCEWLRGRSALTLPACCAGLTALQSLSLEKLLHGGVKAGPWLGPAAPPD